MEMNSLCHLIAFVRQLSCLVRRGLTSLLKSLTPDKKERKLKVRVLRRGGIEIYDTRRGLLDIMKLILIDEEGTQIRALLYSHEMSRLGAATEKDKTYLIENENINPIEKIYHNVNDKFELSLSASTNVSKCNDNFMMPKRCYNFMDYAKLEDAKGAVKDIIGVVVKVHQPITLKVGKTTKRDANKREISLFDGRSNITTVALWADLSNNEGEFLSNCVIRREHAPLRRG